jgi:DNA repair exonuclease SbcCD ATPase subunit
MKLTEITVEGCGRFSTAARIEGLGPGVNILSAHNEAGKSTFFRAIRTCLFERHNTTRDEVKRLATEGVSLPLKVTLGFEHDGKSYELSKSFNRSAAASLRCGGAEIARARAADETVWELLGLKPDNKIDQAAYGVLWVEQGHSFRVPEPSEAAASALNDVIQQEVGTLVGGERARAVLAQVRDELSKLVSDSGKPRAHGPLDAATKELAQLTADRIDAEQRLKELDDSLESLARQRAELKRVSDPVEVERLKRELTDAQQQQKAGEEAATAIRALENEEKQALALLHAQQEKHSDLLSRAERIDGNRARFRQIAEALTPLAGEERESVRLLNEATAKKATLETEANALDAAERQLQRLAIVSRKSAGRQQLQTRLDALREIDRKLTACEAALKSATVDESALRSLDAIERAEDVIRARMEAGAARIVVEARGDAAVTINGQPAAGGSARAVIETLRIDVGTDVSITVSPPLGSMTTAEVELQAAREKLKALLARHDAASPADMRRMRQERLAVEEHERQLRAERNALGLKDQPVLAEIQTLSAEIASIDAEMARALAEIGAASLPDASEIEARQQALQQKRGELRQAGAQCDGSIKWQNAALAKAASTRGKLDGQMKEIDASLRGDLAILPDDGRTRIIADSAALLEERNSQHRAKAALLEEKRASAPEAEDVDRLRNRASRLQEAAANRTRDIQALQVKISNLEGQIETAGGAGLGERAALLKLQAEMALAEVERHTERVSVLNLLKATVEQCYAKRREQLNAPLRRHLKPFLNDVFPQSDIELGDNFTVAGLKRSGPASELFGKLSAGTQEQVAVLVRLAMGAMICEKCEDVPIILDDALVYSDDERIEQMFDAINRAGRNQQVIVLTCRARSFASLGGRQLSIV